jgi:hypothetical protein
MIDGNIEIACVPGLENTGQQASIHIGFKKGTMHQCRMGV